LQETLYRLSVIVMWLFFILQLMYITHIVGHWDLW